jgi:hypothetical protein
MEGEPVPFTWGSFFKAALAVAAEVALLSLVADSPLTVKIATLITALLGLLTLEMRWRLVRWRRRSFEVAIGGLAALYGCFVVYGVYHAVLERQITGHLQKLYFDSDRIEQKDFPAGKGVLDSGEETIWLGEKRKWENETSVYIQENVGTYARSLFLSGGNESYSVVYFSDTGGGIRDLRVGTMRSNLSHIISERNDR